MLPRMTPGARRPVEVPRPLLMRCACARTTPSSHVTSRCLPCRLDDSISAPGPGRGPDQSGASKRSIVWSTSAERRAAAAWRRSPSGIDRPPYAAVPGRWWMSRSCTSRGPPTVSAKRVASCYGSSPTWARARRMQAVVAAGHLVPITVELDRLGGREPRQVESLLGRLAIAVDRHDVGEAHGVVAGVVEARPCPGRGSTRRS